MSIWSEAKTKFNRGTSQTSQTVPFVQASQDVQKAIKTLSERALAHYPQAGPFFRYARCLEILTGRDSIPDLTADGWALMGRCRVVMERLSVADIVSIWGTGEGVQEAFDRQLAEVFPEAVVAAPATRLEVNW